MSGSRELTLIRYTIDRPMSWVEVLDRLRGDGGFRARWNDDLATAPFDFQWKPVPLHPSTWRDAPFFVVLVPSVYHSASPSDFAEPLARAPAEQDVVDFDNLGGDARLVVPRPPGDFGHLASFCRTATPAVIDEFWIRVADLAADAVAGGRPVWCNFHGHGVPWVHVRFDTTHKYTAFPPRGALSPENQRVWYETLYEPVFGQS